MRLEKPVGLADVFQGPGGIEGEDRGVVVAGIEPVEHRSTRALDEVRRAQ